MADKFYNKVVYGGKTLIDLTLDDVTASDVKVGVYAHYPDGTRAAGTYTSDGNAAAGNILKDKIAYANGSRIVGTMPNIGVQNGSITTTTGAGSTVSISAGYHSGGGSIGISADAISNLTATNIRQGVTVLGITGTMSPGEGITSEEKTVSPSTSENVVVTPTTATYLSKVTVSKIPVVEAEVAGGISITIG